MSNPASLMAIEYAAETSFAEDSSTTSALRLPLRDAVHPTLRRGKEPYTTVAQYMHDAAGYVRMGDSGEFTIKMDLTGHGSTTAGSPSLTEVETFLGYVWGNVALSLAASQTMTGGTVTAPTTSGANGVSAGGLVRLGSLGDGDGEGQVYAVSTHATSTLNVLNALAGAPANGQVIYPMAMMYLHEIPYGTGLNATTPGLRFKFFSNNEQYLCHGCYPTAMTLSGLSPGERPTCDITFAVSRWSAIDAAANVSAVSTTTFTPNPNAAGTLFVNDVGTATRSVRTYRNLTVDIALGMQGLPGPGGVSAYQSNVGCVRTPSTVTWTWVEDAGSRSTSPTLHSWAEDNTKRIHILATLSPVLGKQVALYSPNVCISQDEVVQFNDGGINRVRFKGVAHSGPTKTNDLTVSMLRMGWG